MSISYNLGDFKIFVYDLKNGYEKKISDKIVPFY